MDPATRAVKLLLASDASRSWKLGMGAVFPEINQWIFGQWDPQFIQEQQPSIEFLELYALMMAVATWNCTELMTNRRVEMCCNNESVVYMINNSASSCTQCQKLIRIITLLNLRANRRLFARHLSTHLNLLPDALSRLNFKKFWALAPREMAKQPCNLPKVFWPPSKIWFCKDITVFF